MQVMQASFGNSIQTLYGQQIALSVAHPADGCAAFDNQADVAGTVVLVLRGTCFFAVKVSDSTMTQIPCAGISCQCSRKHILPGCDQAVFL